MNRKKIWGLVLTVSMTAAFGIGAAAEAEVESADKATAEYTVEIPEYVMNGFTKLDMDEADVNRIFSFIESSVSEYLEEYEISPEEFAWPEYKRDGLTEMDEDNSWMYLNIIWANYSSDNEERYCTDGYEYPLPSEEHTALMHAVLDGMISWAEEYQNEEKLTADMWVYRVGDMVLVPFGEKLPEIIKFTQE